MYSCFLCRRAKLSVFTRRAKMSALGDGAALFYKTNLFCSGQGLTHVTLTLTPATHVTSVVFIYLTEIYP